eukprot:TRINITY_DN3950_c0_g1_i1.p1 TRINITY_DN3950_c0_g1~~TRINITY_DN3950_c0_g1_i1.p1  ORF type:complete len:460 (-),score=158.47 TRINITY_DN3950_c0_g1_i1:52-1431(-)
MAARIDASDPAIQQAIDDIKNPNSSTRWILLDYVPKSDTKLKVADTGTGGLEEMCEWLNDGKVMFFLIWFEINKVKKYAYISWCGEGVTGMKKGVFNNHANDVANVFKGAFHVQVNARSDKDIKEKLIVDKLTKATGASYDSGAKVQGSAKLVPTSVAQGREQSGQSNAKVRQFEKTVGSDQSTENRPQASGITYESRALDQSTESRPQASSITYEQKKLDQSTENRPQQSTLPGNTTGRVAPTGNASSVRAKFEQPPPSQNAPAPRPVPGRLPGKISQAPSAPTPVQAAPARPPNAAPAPPPPANKPPPRQPSPEPEPVPEPEPEYVPEEVPPPVDDYPQEEYQPAQDEYYAAQDDYQQEQYQQEEYPPPVESNDFEAPSFDAPSFEAPSFDAPAPVESHGSAMATALYDYDAENPGDLSFKEGDVIYILDQSDPSGWWEGELKGVRGFFPSNFVQLQ